MAKSPFLDNYIKEMTEITSKLRPELSIEKIKEIITEQVMNNPAIANIEDDVTIENNYENIEEQCSLLDVMDFYIKKKPIMTGYGVMYNNHSDAENLNAAFVKFLMDERKVFKKIQFEGLNEKDTAKENFGEMMQKTMKLLNNSYYGVTSEKNSQFYNEIVGPSITYSGYSIITTSILGFEMILSNNVHYDNFTDLMIYINRILRDRKTQRNLNGDKTKILDILDKDKIKSANDTYKAMKKLVTVKMDKDELDNLKIVLKKCTNEELNLLYYTNNLFEFLENSTPKNILAVILEDEIQNPSKIKEETKKLVMVLWEMIKNFVVYDYQIFNRADRALTMERESILVVDTDSNFLSLDKWFKWCEKTYSLKIDPKNPEEEIKVFTIINSAVLILSQFIQLTLDRLTGNSNVPEDKQPIINMKNEFYYPRILLTRNKKQYAGLLRLQEGNIIDPPKIDMKGMSIKKANVNNRTREIFTDLIEKEILTSDDVNLSTILGIFMKFEEEIRESLTSGDISFLTPAKVNDFSSYKVPEQMQAVRGTIAWNALYPSNNIQTPAKINLLKLKGTTIDELEPIFELPEFGIIQEAVFNDEQIGKYGFGVLALPKSVTKIPDWVIPLIDIDSIIDDNIRVGILLLESLGFKLMKYNNKEYFSTFINF